MKQLTKAKIINWHYFWNETIPLKPLVFLTGLNGSGKSTIIDALQVVLLGDTLGKFFNKAAMDKSARTLKGYLRGELGDSTDGTTRYLRPGRFTSYIALEYFDDLHKKFFVLGIVFDSYETGDEEHSFFFLDGPLPDNEFIKDNVPLNKKDLSEFLSKEYGYDHKFFQSNVAYREFLKVQLGGLKDKYFALLKKATSFSPITDITKFITEFICDPQDNINLESLQSNILEYKKLEEEAKKLQIRIDLLEKINQSYTTYVDYLHTYNIGRYILEKCQIEECKETISKLTEKISVDQARLKEIDSEIASQRTKINNYGTQKIQLLGDKSGDSATSLLNDLNVQKTALEADILKIESQEAHVKTNLKSLCDSYLDAISELETNIKSFDLNQLGEDSLEDIKELQQACGTFSEQCMNFKVQYVEKIGNLTHEAYDGFRTQLAEFKNVVSGLAVSLSKHIKNLNATISSLRVEQETISSGKKTYPIQYERIRDYIQAQLSKDYKADVSVNFLCDLIDIEDASWTDAIEGYLNVNRFYLFVDNKYFHDAFNCLRQYIKLNGYTNVAIVDTEKIVASKPAAEPGSLADEIKTTHDGARAYVNFLIGRLYKCKDVVEARERGRGITKDCSLYLNYTLTTINPRLYEISYIGTGVSKRSVEDRAKQLQANLDNLATYNKLNNLISRVNNLESISSTEVETNLIFIQDISQLAELRQSLNQIKEQLKSQDTNHILDSIDQRIENIDKQINACNEKIDALNIEKGNLQNEIQTIEEDKIVGENNKIAQIQERLEGAYTAELIEEANVIFEDLRNQGRRSHDILVEFSKETNKFNYILADLKRQLIKDRKTYCLEYHLSYDTEGDDNTNYDEDLTEYRENQLPRYQEKIQDSYNKATQQFKEEFISKLRSAIEEVEDQMENLNEALKDCTFGKDSYRFTVTPSQVYRRYYDMIKDDILLENNESFIDKYREVMDDLFKQIIDIGDSKKNSELLQNVAKYTDYRNYLDFDIIVYNKDTGTETKLSTKMKTNSGGETQTPFYIAVLASFAQLYHVNDKGELGNTGRIIIFDEAFSKMDRSRIQQSVRLLKDFDLQVIVSAPSDKVGDISQLVDETLVVLRSSHSSSVKLFAEDKVS